MKRLLVALLVGLALVPVSVRAQSNEELQASVLALVLRIQAIQSQLALLINSQTPPSVQPSSTSPTVSSQPPKDNVTSPIVITPTATTSSVTTSSPPISQTPPPPTNQPPDSCKNLNTSLKAGDFGTGVEALQSILNSGGAGLPVVGIFGPRTLTAVKSFQLDNLGSDYTTGFVGQLTLAKLKDKYCNPDTTPPIGGNLPPTISPLNRNFDVIVVGAGSGGVAAAIEAARLGVSVALLEETDTVGGQMIPVPNMDEYVIFPQGSGGIYGEFRNKAANYYADPTRFPPNGKSVGTCYWGENRYCFEPKVVQQILLSMINAESRLKLFTQTKVVNVSKSGNAVTGVVTSDGTNWQSKIVIDATEYGDIIPLTGAAYRVGNSVSSSVNPNSCIQDITYVTPIKKYPNGVPSNLKLNNPPPKYEEYKEEFRNLVTKTGNYPYAGVMPVNFLAHNQYRGLPDSSNPASYTSLEGEKITKTALNWTNDYPGYLTSATLKVSYLENQTERKRLNCEAKLKTLGFIYYVQHDLGEVNWSVANDEGFDTAYNRANLCDNIPAEYKIIERNFPPFPYVRESRRIVAINTLTAAEIKANKTDAANTFPTSVAMGDYGSDLHNCNTNQNLESDLGETLNDSFIAGPFQVPLEVLIPQSLDGFLAAEKNIGVSRLANGGTRLQPITMQTGEAAGALAALSVQGGLQPRQVNPSEVQNKVVEAKSYISKLNFTDVPIINTFWKAVQLVSSHGAMVGYGNQIFGITDSLTRAQAAIALTKAFNISTSNPPATPTFGDVPATHPQFKEIEALRMEGITAGCSDSPLLYCPDSATTRAQMAILLVRAMRGNTSRVSQTPYFEDVPASNPAFPFVQFMYEKGMTAGCSSAPLKFCPNDSLPRSQAAVFVSRAFTIKTN